MYAEIDARRGGAADDDAFLAIRHASGAYSHLRASAVSAAPGPRLRVLGTRAAYIVDELDRQEADLRDGLRPAGETWGAAPPGRLVRGEEISPVTSENGDWPAFYRGVARWLRGAAESPPVDPRDALRVLEVLDAARRSASKGSTIRPQGMVISEEPSSTRDADGLGP